MEQNNDSGIIIIIIFLCCCSSIIFGTGGYIYEEIPTAARDRKQVLEPFLDFRALIPGIFNRKITNKDLINNEKIQQSLEDFYKHFPRTKETKQDGGGNPMRTLKSAGKRAIRSPVLGTALGTGAAVSVAGASLVGAAVPLGYVGWKGMKEIVWPFLSPNIKYIQAAVESASHAEGVAAKELKKTDIII